LQVVDGKLTAVQVQDDSAFASSKRRPVSLRTAVSSRSRARRFGDIAASDRVVHRGAATGVGTACAWARPSALSSCALDCFYGHVQHRDALSTNTLWPYPVLDMVAAAGIVVNGRGPPLLRRRAWRHIHCQRHRQARRSCVGARRLRQDDARRLDKTIWEGPGTSSTAANPYLTNTGADIFNGENLAAVAGKAGLPGDALVQTVAAYNAALSAGGLGALSPPRSGHLYQPFAITAAPFYVVPLAAGMTYTLGGILTDEYGRVQHVSGGSITGVYAAGATTGGLEGGPFAGYTGGLTKSLVFGLRCAEHIAGVLHNEKSAAIHPN